MIDNFSNRQDVLRFLSQELVGPAPVGKEIDCSQPVKFASIDEARGPWVQKDTGDEILQRDPPTKRYGIGVLYPFGSITEPAPQDAGAVAVGLINSTDEEEQTLESLVKDSALQSIEQTMRNLESTSVADEMSDLDLSSSNTYRPSSMGISFLAHFLPGSKLVVRATGGRYHSFEIPVGESKWSWWLRKSVSITEEYDGSSIALTHTSRVRAVSRSEENSDGLSLHIEVFSRPKPHARDDAQRIVTVCLVNRSDQQGRIDEYCLFQSKFQVEVVSPDGKNCILPYPESPLSVQDDEERSLSLLYRDFDTYAVGHGCAANWATIDEAKRTASVSAECLPYFETPSITPDIKDKNGNPVEVSMASLAGLDPSDDGFTSLGRIITLYKEWIEEKQPQLSALPPEMRATAERHLKACEECASRMLDGLNYLHASPAALKAFRLANQAMLLQQLNSRREARTVTYNPRTHRNEFAEAYKPTMLSSKGGRGKWRAFQVAFLLMSLQSSVEQGAPDRRTVELIWFPTGGGKTEAYLGLAAFTLFMRRLRDPNDIGVHVLMRYTLRLLTAQQFQRASGLICAMETIRRSAVPELGEEPFSIGIWVGGSTTPNTRSEATEILSGLNRGDRFTENKFIVSRCPWCGAQMGPISFSRRSGKDAPKLVGYSRAGNTVIFRCPDTLCPFTSKLPIYVIDEDIYENKPSVVIGTVDKFATLAWKPESRALFGIDEHGSRQNSPPGLIIQDELHLIAGPLGSMVGLYEAVIEELCTDRRIEPPIPPKIVSSTATIRRYAEQIKALYGRADVVLFPPAGISADDSFFARYAVDSEGRRLPGRLYVGVHAPGLGSLQTVQVRTFTALLQAPIAISEPAGRDPWWTLLLFFNSLRELGTTLSLLQSDIPDYLKVMGNRRGTPLSGLRNLWRVRELTGRLRSDEVPEAISDLEISGTSTSDKRPVDVCLASNILEVGIDIDRLSLMSVVGQPKSTSQYIQVTGRVGRSWWERPGLVVTIYTASKPRDRSHFERFRSYHERLYAQVEPISVTPFSPPVLDRALHAVMALFVRQTGYKELATNPYPYPAELIDNLRDILLPRVRNVDDAELANFKRVFNERAADWKRWQRTEWGSMAQFRAAYQDIPLLRSSEAYATAEQKLLSWPTPTSMRNVDAECEAQITTLYLQQDEEDTG